MLAHCISFPCSGLGPLFHWALVGTRGSTLVCSERVGGCGGGCFLDYINIIRKSNRTSRAVTWIPWQSSSLALCWHIPGPKTDVMKSLRLSGHDWRQYVVFQSWRQRYIIWQVHCFKTVSIVEKIDEKQTKIRHSLSQLSESDDLYCRFR